MDEARDTLPVLIVGAGPVGLALAGDLGWRGRRCRRWNRSRNSWRWCGLHCGRNRRSGRRNNLRRYRC